MASGVFRYQDVSIPGANNVHLGNTYVGANSEDGESRSNASLEPRVCCLVYIYLLPPSDYPGVTVDKLISDLFLTDPASDLSDITRQKGKRIPGSCQWLLNRDEFQSWIVDDDKLHVLWLLGAPGIGKTMISSYVVEVLQKKEESSSAIFIFYFCNDRNDDRRTTPAIVRGLLVQLLRKQPGLFEAIKDDYGRHGKSIAENLSALFVAFSRLLRRTEARLYILIDALDECEGLSRHDFFTFIEDLDSDMKVSIIITSRPEVDVEDAVGDTNILRVDSAKVNDDLSRFIDIKVDELAKKKKRFPAKLVEDIRNMLQQQAGGTFLWVSLALEDIASATTAKRAREKLEGLPKGLPGIYRRILDNIREEDVDDAAFILRWVVASRRPMTVDELATAQAMTNWEGDAMPRSDDLDELLDGYRVCGPLLFHDLESDTVNLAHQSAKDFLTTIECPETYRVDRYEAQMCILQTCFDYFALPEFEQGNVFFSKPAVTLQDSEQEKGDSIPAVIFKRHTDPLGRHFFKDALRTGPLIGYPAITATVLAYTRSVLGYTGSFLEYSNDEIVSFADGLMPFPWAAAFLRRCRNLRALPEILSCWLVEWSSHSPSLLGPQTPSRGPSGGQENSLLEICRALMENGADLASRVGYEAKTALHAAAIVDNTGLISFLLGRGAPIDLSNRYGNTPFFVAVVSGSEKAALLLLSKGADFHTKGTDYYRHVLYEEPALFAAVWHGHCGIVKALINNGVSLSKAAKTGEPPLAFAVESGHVSVAKLLIKHGADPAWIHDETNVSLIHLATMSRSVAMLRFVLKSCNKTDVDSIAYIDPIRQPIPSEGHNVQLPLHDPRGKVQRTALQLATTFGGPEMAELLLELKTNVNARAGGMTALHVAASFEVGVPVMKCLLNGGAYVDGQDWRGGTALHRASSQGIVENINTLLEHHADINARDLLGWTALHRAASYSQVEAVHVLLHRWAADANAETNDGETPLHLASGSWRSPWVYDPPSGVKAVVSLLLQNGGSAKAITKKGLTPLHQFAKTGNLMIKSMWLCLQESVDVNTTDPTGRTPLRWEAAGDQKNGYELLHVNVAWQLLRKGASVMARCNEGCTPLYEAAKACDRDMCLLLLRWGADAFSMVEPEAANEQYPGSDQLREAIKFYLDSVKMSCDIRNNISRAIVGSDTEFGTEECCGEGTSVIFSWTGRYSPATISMLDSLFEKANSLQPSSRVVARSPDPFSDLSRRGEDKSTQWQSSVDMQE